MTRLIQLVPDAKALLSLEPEELGWQLLQVARAQRQTGGLFHPDNYLIASSDLSEFSGDHNAIQIAVAEGWDWLRRAGLLIPALGTNGANGWHVLSRRAERIASQEQFGIFRKATVFPQSLLHASIAQQVWLMLLRGDFDTAVFQAFREVEIQVRDAGGFADTDIGVDLMRKAFNSTNGPLTDPSQPVAEREALSSLFAGAIGSYKNPHSHRRVQIDAAEAQEMVVLASHLLRIIEDRQAQRLAQAS